MCQFSFGRNNLEKTVKLRKKVNRADTLSEQITNKGIYAVEGFLEQLEANRQHNCIHYKLKKRKRLLLYHCIINKTFYNYKITYLGPIIFLSDDNLSQNKL